MAVNKAARARRSAVAGTALSPLRVEDLGTVLGVWAHPDDEAYLSAGLMAAVRDAGQPVAVATATYGELGSPDPQRWNEARMAELRRHELIASLAVAGIHDHHWLGFYDGQCPSVSPDAGAAAVGRIIDEFRPDTILTFGPEGMTGHTDHQTVSSWTTAAWLARGASARLLYATLTPEFHEQWGPINDRLGIWMSGTGPSTPAEDVALQARFTGAALDRKLVSLRAHASQTAGLVEHLGPDEFGRWWATETFVAAVSTAATKPVPASAEAGGAR
jgi:LmbE family N-acetylglucosaminyl deacetylase